MSWLDKQIKTITGAAEAWLHPENKSLQKAIAQTVEEKLFSKEDIEFQLTVLRQNIQNKEVGTWAARSGLNDQQNARGKSVLCLHAGNLPLVGFQTALGTILSGADYQGKLSRKDPYLLASFLDELSKTDSSQTILYNTHLQAFENLLAEQVVFAGSDASVPAVKQEINALQAAKPNARYLIRTAKFSIAYIDEWSEEVKTALVEALLRYGGKGCRSVGVVVSSFSLEQLKEELKAEIQTFWELNPPHQKPEPGLKYQYAYNMAVGRAQLWLKDFLIQETGELPEADFVTHWVKGDVAALRNLRMNFEGLVQSVYTPGDKIDGLKTEPLHQAQKPPLFWQPDGVDVVEELIVSQ